MRSRRRKNKENMGANLLIGVSCLAIAIMGFTAYQSFKKSTPEANYCYDGGDPGTWALVDVSNPIWDSAQQRGLEHYFEILYTKRLQFNEQIQLFVTEMDRASALPKPVFKLCRPPHEPEDLETVDAEAQSQRYIDKVSRRIFQKSYWPVIENVLTETDTNFRESPVLEMVQSLSELQGMNGEKMNRLAIVGDMIQNADGVHFCAVEGHLPSFEKFKKSEKYVKLKPKSLAGVDVEILFLVRPGYTMVGTGLEYCSEAELRRFWTALFKDAGAKSITFTRLRTEA